MSVLQRTQYRSASTGTVRTGATGHGESLVDVEQYLLPVDRLRTAALHSWGVVTGLAVRGAVGVAGVTVSTGSALDAVGQVVVLVEGGLAVVDPTVDPDQVQDVPTVPVTAGGVDLDTAGSSGEVLLTVSWREVQGESALANAPVLMHAPWLRLLPEAELPGAGRQVVLARISLDADGQVTAVTAGPRRTVGLTTGRIELHASPADAPRPLDPRGAPLSVEQAVVADLAADPHGDVALSTGAGAARRRALTVEAATGTVSIGGALEIAAALRLQAPEGRRYDVTSNEDGTWRLTDATAGVDRLTVSAAGEGGGLDVARRMRVRQGGDWSAGIWLHQDVPEADRAFVGMVDDERVGFWGVPGGWGLHMDVRTLQVTTTRNLDVGGSGPLPRWSGGGVGAWDVFARGAVYVGPDMTAPQAYMAGDGSIVGKRKAFLIDHPLDPERRWLRHVCPEGPEAAVFYRGEGRLAAGTAEVRLPPYFEALTRSKGRTVQLTPVTDGQEPISVLAATPVDGGRFVVHAADGRNPSQRFCWEVTAVRADVEPVQVETDKADRAAGLVELLGARS